MGIFAILLLGIELAMDAFAVSICKGLDMKKCNYYCFIFWNISSSDAYNRILFRNDFWK